MRPDKWNQLNREAELRLLTYPNIFFSRRCVRVKSYVKRGVWRWETQLLSNGDIAVLHVYFIYPTKAEAMAKAVELVLKGYAMEIVIVGEE